MMENIEMVGRWVCMLWIFAIVGLLLWLLRSFLNGVEKFIKSPGGTAVINLLAKEMAKDLKNEGSQKPPQLTDSADWWKKAGGRGGQPPQFDSSWN